jgi:hypothetical protein
MSAPGPAGFRVDLGGTALAASDIPEPATMAMLGLAVAALGGYVKRRRKA